ncbi:MAG: DMT family transporter, partial [Clostridia bacterium]|nr:DMT family transporter [Clostridia bacterium]
MNKKSKTALGFILTLTGGIFWGFSGSCGQYLFTYHSVTSNWLVPIRMLFTGIILLLICAVKNKKRIFDVWHGKKNIAVMAAFTLFGLVMCQYAYFRAIEFSNAGVATVLQYLSPAMILAFTCIKSKRMPRVFEIVAIILAIGGTFLIASGGAESMQLSSKALFWG